jgi:twinkle protein
MTSNIIERHVQCPSCPSSDAYCLYEDGHGYCFSCNYFYKPNRENVLEDCTYEYLPWRGISKTTMEFFDCKTKVSSEGVPVELGYRYPNSSYKIRSLSEKDFRAVKGRAGESITDAGLFGRDKFSLGTHKYVTITEGELDALSLYQVLRSPVVSVQSATTASRDCTVDRSWLNSFERVYIAFDNDQAGRDAARNVARLFDYNKVYLVRFGRKDANDYLLANEPDVLRNIWWNSKKYLPDNILSSFQDFKEVLEQPTHVGVPYPFPTLTEMTYGMRTGESVLLTAQEGVGKTELMHAIEYQLLKETDDGVAAIYLEEPKKRHLQAIAGLEIKRPAHLPDSGCSNHEVYSALERVLEKDDRLHVYSHFGSDDPDALLDTIRFLVVARGCRWVMFDHITMAVSGLAGEDERRALDHLSTRLEMMVKELDFGLIIVSHVNDVGQTRGSRYISKIADIRIDATRDLLSADPVIRNTTQLVISKNRFCGKTGPAGVLVFDLATYSYREIREGVEDGRHSSGEELRTSVPNWTDGQGEDTPLPELQWCASPPLHVGDELGVRARSFETIS